MNKTILLIALIGIYTLPVGVFAASGSVSVTAEPTIEEKIAPVLEPVKKTGISLFEKIDAWRVRQADIWRALKSEKELQVETRTTVMYDKVDARRDAVLEGEQASLVQGAGDDFDGKIFLYKLYVAVLGVFVIIFSSPVLFFGLSGILVLGVLYKMIMRFRGQ